MMSRALGTVALLTSFPGFAFSISPLIMSKIPKFLGILFINETHMEKNRRKIEKAFFQILKNDSNMKL